MIYYGRCIKRNFCVNLAYFSFDTSFFAAIFVAILWLRCQGIFPSVYVRNAYYDGNGKNVTYLGVHEHWNNSVEKIYGCNLGKEEGIELIRILKWLGELDMRREKSRLTPLT